MTPARSTFVRVVHPEWNGPGAFPMPGDYIAVPRLVTYGRYRIIDLINPDSVIALARLANSMEFSTRARAVRRRRYRVND